MSLSAQSLRNRALVGSLIRDVEDFPRPGVMFKDITPLLASPDGFSAAVVELVEASPRDIDVVIGMEARGFIFAAPVALAMGAGFVPVRKPGKLPLPSFSETFALEYGSETLTVHQDAIPAGSRVLIVDDVLATGGTVVATSNLVKKLGATVSGISVLMELSALGGNDTLAQQGLPHAQAVVTVA